MQMKQIKQKVSPALWFDNNGEEAVNFYISVFKNSKINKIIRYGEAGPGPSGTVMAISFELDGEEFTAINGGPHFTFSPAISFVVKCVNQDEVDYYWEKLSAGGRQDQCGWLADKFGVSWQVVPVTLLELLDDPDPAKSKRVMEAVLHMHKIEIELLRRAYAQTP
jgi:predicted 3-demethylubiquinone-9 3-methyltransferase (glyoxalase superfamily)